MAFKPVLVKEPKDVCFLAALFFFDMERNIMAMIKVENLTFAYPGIYRNIFENCSFRIDTDWKLGLVGRNGRGKTTLLNLLLDKYKYNGQIISSVKFDYFPCPVPDKKRPVLEIMANISPTAREWELLRELAYLEVDADILNRRFDTLSNGEQTKVLLAAFFLNEGRFQLIDEPTDHLDLNARKTVAAYLKRKKGFILVSHDRAFLDDCVDHILSLNKTSIDVQNGNFSTWMKAFEDRKAYETGQNEQLRKEIRRLHEAARRTAAWSDRVESMKTGNGPVDRGYIGHKAAKMMKRSTAISARQEKAIEEKSALLKNVERADDLKISPLPHHAQTLAQFSNITIYSDEKPVCGPVSFEIDQGARLALAGKNGSGKSSLLKLLLGQDISYSGTLRLASGLIISYVPQDPTGLSGSLNEFTIQHSLDRILFNSLLSKLDFGRAQYETDIATYSLGQKKKVLIAKSLCERAHLYVWDEPLNYVDIYSRMQIERLILRFRPTMIFVEHDRAFQKAAATRTVEIQSSVKKPEKSEKESPRIML